MNPSEFTKLIGRADVKIEGYGVEIDPGLGTLLWSKDPNAPCVYATPYWEGCDGIAINVVFADGGNFRDWYEEMEDSVTGYFAAMITAWPKIRKAIHEANEAQAKCDQMSRDFVVVKKVEDLMVNKLVPYDDTCIIAELCGICRRLLNEQTKI